MTALLAITCLHDERDAPLFVRPAVRLVLWRGTACRRCRARCGLEPASARGRVVAGADAVAREHAPLYSTGRRAHRADERPAVWRAVPERSAHGSLARARLAARGRRCARGTATRSHEDATNAARHSARALRAGAACGAGSHARRHRE